MRNAKDPGWCDSHNNPQNHHKEVTTVTRTPNEATTERAKLPKGGYETVTNSALKTNTHRWEVTRQTKQASNARATRQS